MKRILLLLLCSSIYLNVKAQAPNITSFTPTTAKPGDAVTLTGTGFNTITTNNVVFFGATRATVTGTPTATNVTVTVPTGATYAPITLLNTGTKLAAYSLANFNPIYAPAKTKITTADFAPNQDFTSLTDSYSVAVGDLDGDGKSDLVVVISGSVSVFRNTSSSGSITAGSFAPKVDFTVTNPVSVTIGDLDGDDKPDLAISNGTSSSISILRNTSTSGTIDASSFAAVVDFPTGNGSTPSKVAIGDLDGDGKPDLVFTSAMTSNVFVLRNTSTSGTIDATSFAAKVSFTTGGFPNSVAIGDLDGDGKPDLAVLGISTNSVSILRNISTSGSITTGSFAANEDFVSGTTGSTHLVIGDLDGDGKPDMALANPNSNSVSVLRNTRTSGSIMAGSFSFAAKEEFNTGTTPYSVAIGDLDGDGKPDLAATNYSSNSVSVLRNTSTSGSITAGSFAAKVDIATGDNPNSLCIGDLDNDGKPDLTLVTPGSASVSVFQNIYPQAPIITSFTPQSAKPGDVVTLTGTGFNTTNTDNIVFFGATRATVSAATATSITATVPNGATYAPITLLNTGTSLAAYSLSNFTPIFSPAKTAITAGDFSTKIDFTTGSNPFSVAIGDLDGDGKADLAVANAGSNTVSVYRNTSGSGSIDVGSFATKVDFTTGSSPFSVAIGDLDGDGKADLAVTNFNSSSISVLRNTSSSGSINVGSFATKVDFTTGTNPFSVDIGDLDGDGKADLAVANNQSNNVSVLRNTSSSGSINVGSFATRVNFTTGANPFFVAIGDLDGDGKADLAVANQNSSSVSVLAVLQLR